MRVTVFAPAKINLSLHVCGKRADGYHLLDSLVVFAAVGDSVVADSAADISLTITGPFAEGLSAGEDNLVVRAARLLGDEAGHGAHLKLDKHLPVASGIGGGSSDAAATLMACATLWGRDVALMPDAKIAGALGADVPVCLARAPRRMRGIGDQLVAVPPLPPAWLVLVNPNRPLATKSVFHALAGRHSGPLRDGPPRTESLKVLVEYLRACGNDLDVPAIELMPEIAETIAAVGRQAGCLLSRMSGSGPTCFGLFGDTASAAAAAAAVQAARPGWWVRAGAILAAGDPQLAPITAR